MATDYEKIYQDYRHALGAPTKEFVCFFERLEGKRVFVLDVGCGQGRDSLFIARLGHHVTGIDQSPSAIRDLRKDAATEGLFINADVTDVRNFVPSSTFDVIVIDRTLHMLNPEERQSTLCCLLKGATHDGSAVLIADERSNISSFEAIF